MNGVTVNLGIIIAICSAIITIAGAATVILKVVKNTVTKYSKNVIDSAIRIYAERTDTSIALMQDVLNQDIFDINVKLEEFIQKSTESDELLKDTLKAMAREKINQVHKECSTNKIIDRNTLQAIEKLFDSYKALNGNGYVKDLMIDLRTFTVI